MKKAFTLSPVILLALCMRSMPVSAHALNINTQRELVLVTTRRGKGKEGLRVAAQTGLVKDNSSGVSTNTGVVHQYYAGVYKNLAQVSFGVSADWRRDLMPLLKDGICTAEGGREV